MIKRICLNNSTACCTEGNALQLTTFELIKGEGGLKKIKNVFFILSALPPFSKCGIII